MRALKLISLSSLLLCAVLTACLAWYVRQAPDLGRLTDVSQVIRAHDGTIINLRLTKDGYWREKATLGTIDPKLVNVLIAYEDQRFWDHRGVDPKAIIRASYDFVKSGRIVSGASTLTMQVSGAYRSLPQATSSHRKDQANACSATVGISFEQGRNLRGLFHLGSLRREY